MSTTTANLGLFKYDTSADRDTAFSINTALNNNWDKIDNLVVKKSGDMMSGNLTVKKGTPGVYLRNEDITKGTNPSTSQYFQIINADNSGTGTASRMAEFRSTYKSTGDASTEIRQYKPEYGSTDYSNISVGYDSSGNIYTYAPTPSESSNNTNIATTEWVNTKISDTGVGGKVSKSGDTMTGDLTIEETVPIMTLKNTSIVKGTIPSANKSSVLYFKDNENASISHISSGYTTAGAIYTGMYAYQPVSGSTTSSSIKIYYPTEGSAYTYAPASDVKNSILTTTGISKASNGYLKLGNGVIMQWFTGTTANSSTVRAFSLPTAFTSTDYFCAATTNAGTQTSYKNWGGLITVFTRTTTKVSLHYYTGSQSEDRDFLAFCIGY